MVRSLLGVPFFFHLPPYLVPVRHFLERTAYRYTVQQHQEHEEYTRETGDAIYLLTADKKHLLHER